ncbi:hypothetical protein Q8P09_12170 [Psychrobacter faecalis]|uniref:Uncharacterized protein n=1 Tax=Psychrobacter faecalis TaxID=180588 RepID=A0ABT9HJ63_9GAMM|nr:hypothetical protein [Psychrobacter faecalis]MDP4545830.1 hypothetical protein [Psychrobacter faecalis]
MALRTSLSVTPHLYMGDSTGRPLDKGVVYFGEQDKDPEFYPINLFSDDALTLPLAQPVHTKGGYLYDKGDMVEPHAKEIIYSVKVLDSYGRKVFYKGAMMRNSWNDDVIEQINTAIIGSADVARQVATDITNDAINNTAVEGGVLADTFVTKTVNGIGQVARDQRDKNTDILTPKDFGVKSSFNTDTLADRFDTLVEAKAQYPNAVALTELADRVALDAFLLHLINNRADGADWSCEVLLDKPLVSYTKAKTLLINGDLVLKPHVSGIRYMLHIATDYLNTTGRVDTLGVQPMFSSMLSRLSYHGVVLGTVEKLGLTGTAANCNLSYIKGEAILGFVYLLGANCHFTKIGFVRSSRCGSYSEHGTYPQLSGIVDTVISHVSSGSTLSQKTEITLSNTKLTSEIYNLLEITVFINNKPYQLLSVDLPNNKISVYPQIPSDESVTKVLYIFGGAVNAISNNTACTSIGTLQSITSGSGLRIPALYGMSISSFISEYNGAALLVSGRGEAHLGTSILQAYFEANNADIIYGGALVDYTALTIANSIALNKDKIWNLIAYTMPDGSRRTDYAAMGSGYIDIDGSRLGKDKSVLSLHETTHNTLKLIGSVGGTLQTVQLAYDQKIAELTQRFSKTINFAIEFGAPPIQILPPVGYTINSKTALDIPLQEYEGFVSITFFIKTEIDSKNIVAHILGVRKVKKGTTANRPTNPVIGLRYYDTTLLASGKPIEWNGNTWVDSGGVAV